MTLAQAIPTCTHAGNRILCPDCSREHATPSGLFDGIEDPGGLLAKRIQAMRVG